MAENVVDVSVEDSTLEVESNGSAAPFVVSVEDGICSVAVLAADGKPITTINVIDKETGTVTPVHVSTCAEAVVCKKGIPMEIHLQNLYGHAEDGNAHLTAAQKAALETKEGAQAKATAAQNAAYTAASLLVQAAKTEMATDATNKANGAVTSANSYTNAKVTPLEQHAANKSNPHGVTAAQIGLGNVPNKSTNDLQPTYTEAAALSKLVSGERLAVAFGKIAKAIVDLISHITNKANPHGVTATQAGAVPTTGGIMTGNLNMNGGYIILKRGKNYGTEDEIPDDLPDGALFLKVVG